MVIFDFETGGLTDNHPNIQLAAIVVDANFKELRSYNALIKFDESTADQKALELNHYDPERWAREAKPERLVINEFASFCSSDANVRMVSKRTGRPYFVARLCGHNAVAFDGPRLFAAARNYEIFMPAHMTILDTVQLAGWSRHFSDLKLTTIAQELGIDTAGAHDALTDVRLCAAVARVLTQKKEAA